MSARLALVEDVWEERELWLGPQGQYRLLLRQQPSAAVGLKQQLKHDAAHPSRQKGSDESRDLSNVGAAVWYSGRLLAQVLLQRPPFGGWHGVSVLDLGTGTGVVGLALSQAGAAPVTLADMPHMLPVAAANAAANAAASLPTCPAPAPGGAVRLVAHTWGDNVSQLVECGHPDVITGADLVYEQRAWGPLVASLAAAAAPHTLVYMLHRLRGGEEHFERLLERQGFAVEVLPLASAACDGWHSVGRAECEHGREALGLWLGCSAEGGSKDEDSEEDEGSVEQHYRLLRACKLDP